MSKELTCKLYTDPEYMKQGGMRLFEVIKTYRDDEHSSEKLVRCKECGQLYHYSMEESIDWVNGNDPIYYTYTPIDCEAQLKDDNFTGLPRLQYDWPSDQKEPKIWWNN